MTSALQDLLEWHVASGTVPGAGASLGTTERRMDAEAFTDASVHSGHSLRLAHRPAGRHIDAPIHGPGSACA
jgi:hypothetical protein